MQAKIREATVDDAPALLEIYRPFIEETAITFETVLPSVDAYADRIRITTRDRPWLVAVSNADVAGFAYAATHRVRQAYRFSVEVSVYVAPAFQRHGVARQLYSALFSVLAAQGFVNAYAGIALPNAASVQLHERHRFVPIGVYPHVGFKLGRWHDVGWWRRDLAEPLPNAAEPRPLAALRQSGELSALLNDL